MTPSLKLNERFETRQMPVGCFTSCTQKMDKIREDGRGSAVPPSSSAQI